ncbi:tripartite tricarboxylate transporter substrate binding protein [Bacillus sp. SG-1]|uniref:tripartite tricarboxylate transporter substrate binding protein n=1 Tax=Bacillus sp. SG-1 TaxID=161544 RepID=UPI0002ED0C25|nr:tripartite tricarboxylate transporter substrate binding protein [Bacillus sp. SG-1]
MKKSINKKGIMWVLIIAMTMLLAACGGAQSSQPVKESDSSGKENAETSKETASSSYPDETIKVVVPFGAGGDTDINSRTFAKYVEKELGVSTVVSNVSGAGGSVGSRQVLKAKPDGYTVGAFQDSMLLNSIFGVADFKYDEFEIAGISVLDQGNSFLVSGDSKFKTWDDVVAYAKEHPGEVSVGTNVGAFTYIQLMALADAAGVEFNIVDAGGGADKITALLGGQVDIIPNPLGLVKDYIESGDMVSLGVLSEERIEQFPNVPTFKEQGVDVTFDKIYFWAFPPGTPDEVINTFSQAMEKAAVNEDYIAETEKHVVSAKYMNPEEAKQFLADAYERYQGIYEKTK